MSLSGDDYRDLIREVEGGGGGFREYMAAACARCGRTALGYATIGRKHYCHADERSCYAEQLHDNALNRLFGPFDDLRFLAEIWSDHPDLREGWKP